MNANSYITTDELIYTINHSQEIDRGDEMGPFAVKRGKYAHTPLGFRGTVLSDNDKEELRHRLMGYFKDHSFGEDYRNGRLDAMYGVMCQLGMEGDYDATKGSYKAMKIKAGVENA